MLGGLGGIGVEVAQHLVGVVDLERRCAVVDVGDLGGDGQHRARVEALAAAKAVGVGDQVPERGIAPDVGGDRLQGLAGLDRIAGVRLGLAGRVDRVVARARRERASGDSGLGSEVERAGALRPVRSVSAWA